MKTPSDVARKIPAHIVKRYTCGECHAFAIAVSRRTGWKIKVIFEYVGPRRRYFVHAVCELPHNKSQVVDIQGLHAMSDLVAKYATYHDVKYVKIETAKEAQFFKPKQWRRLCEDDIDFADEWVDEVLAQAGLSHEATTLRRRRTIGVSGWMHWKKPAPEGTTVR